MSILFHTSRLEIIRPKNGDSTFWWNIYQNPKMMAHLGGPFSETQAKERIQRWFEHWEHFKFGTGIIRLKETAEHIGALALFWTKVDGQKVLEIGWSILPSFQKRGFAFEAAQGGVEFAKKRIAPEAIVAFPNPENIASNRILEKLGFIRVRPYQYSYQGRPLESVYWRLEK